MKRIAKITIFVTAAVSAALIAYLCTRPDPIDMLVQRGVPVPVNATATNSDYGGFFAKYLFVRTELQPGALKEYQNRLPAGVALNSAGGVQVVTADLTDAEIMKLIEQETEMRFKHGPPLHWWKIDLIKNGTYHQQHLEDACGYEVFIDNDESVVYIYWHYS